MWSDCHPLEEYYFARNGQGVYEIGTIRLSQFTPLYLGMGNVRKRLAAHHSPDLRVGNRQIQQFLYKPCEENADQYIHRKGRSRLFFHYMLTANPALREARLLRRLGIASQGGYYKFNNRLENGCLDE